MGKGRAVKGVKHAKMDSFTVQHAGGSQQEPGGPPGDACELFGAQILAVIEASGQVVQTQIAAIAADVNLLRTDLGAVVERSVATEKQVSIMQMDPDALKDTVATLETKTLSWR
ncbi:hypothetical protein NDU88_009537 [Pleurodeles waltl]|uniref:Uncharacterized protein n=1 Tax=Pleurodeles waltl TaxID=8319 RepID=A0AAV7QRT3_PLEWA|nr:hypothetical protein NDU88_009537 [Pleurodeles waltl]